MQINNAGSIMSQRDVNAEGLEKSFATNVLGESSVRVRRTTFIGNRGMVMKVCFCLLPGVYILTKSLIPLLEKSGDPRVVSPGATKCVSLHRSYSFLVFSNPL